jgi:hypothetical protein
VNWSGADDEPVRRLTGSRVHGLVLSSILLTLLGLPFASHASAAACESLVLTQVGEPSADSVLVMLPTALIGTELHARNVSVLQGATPLVLRSVQRLAAGRVDVAIVLDTAASAPDAAYARARRLGASFLGALPPDVRVAVVSGGRNPTVLSPLTAPRERALVAVRRASRSGGHAGVDGVALAGDLLSTGSDRSRHVVLISTGSDDTSQRDVAQVVSTLDERDTNLHAVSVRGPVDPSWGSQCPSGVGAGQEAAAGSLLAGRVAEMYELVPLRVDASVPMTVRVRSEPVDVSAELAFSEPDTAVRGSRIEGPQQTGSGLGLKTWTLAGAIGVAAAIVLLIYRLLPAMPAGGALRHRTNPPSTVPLVLGKPDRRFSLAVSALAPPQRPALGRSVDLESAPRDEPDVEQAPEREPDVEPAAERGVDEPPAAERASDVEPAAKRGVDDERPAPERASDVEPAAKRGVDDEPARERGLDDESDWASIEASSPSTPGDLRLEAWVARICLLSVLPLAATVRVVLGHGLLPVGSDPAWAILGTGLALGAVGSWWLWLATSPPYPLSPLRSGPMSSSRLAGPGVAALTPFWLGVLPGALLIMLT